MSPQRQPGVLARSHDLILDHSQLIIATHAPILMAHPDATIDHCSADGISQIAYDETEHDRVTRDFLVDPACMLKTLLAR